MTAAQAARLEPVDQVLSRTSDELRLIQTNIVRLQDAVGALVEQGVRTHIADVQELQYLDHLAQEVAAVADFLGSLSSSLPGNILVDTNESVLSLTLGRLASRLRGLESAGQHDLPPDDYELFG